MANENLGCANKEAHDSHVFEATVQYHCSGAVECGVEVHEPHFFTMKNVPVRCPGVCNCSWIGRPHGPGEHK